MADPARLTGLAGSLVLVRHGETTWLAEGRFQGRSDPPLSPLGELQAARVAARLSTPSAPPALPLSATPPLGVWHSPLLRARAVAAGIASGHAVALMSLDALAEVDQGVWEGLTHAEVERRHAASLAAWRRDPVHHHAPGGESLRSAAGRAGVARSVLLDALRDASPGAPPPPAGARSATAPADPWLVAVAHDGLLRLLLLDLLDLPMTAFWSFPFTLCGVTVVELRDGVARLRAHNLADHLDGLASPATAGLPGR